MIEDVMNRKRESCGLSHSKGFSSPKENTWNQRQEPSWSQKHEVDHSSYKNNGTSYLRNSQYASSQK